MSVFESNSMEYQGFEDRIKKLICDDKIKEEIKENVLYLQNFRKDGSVNDIFEDVLLAYEIGSQYGEKPILKSQAKLGFSLVSPTVSSMQEAVLQQEAE